MMLRGFLRYPGVFKKVSGVKCVYFIDFSNFVPGKIFLKMLPEGAILWVRKTPVLGHLKKILKVAFDCQSPCQQLCPRAYFFKMTPQQVKFTRISGKIGKIINNRF